MSEFILWVIFGVKSCSPWHMETLWQWCRASVWEFNMPGTLSYSPLRELRRYFKAMLLSCLKNVSSMWDGIKVSVLCVCSSVPQPSELLTRHPKQHGNSNVTERSKANPCATPRACLTWSKSIQSIKTHSTHKYLGKIIVFYLHYSYFYWYFSDTLYLK